MLNPYKLSVLRRAAESLSGSLQYRLNCIIRDIEAGIKPRTGGTVKQKKIIDIKDSETLKKVLLTKAE